MGATEVNLKVKDGTPGDMVGDLSSRMPGLDLARLARQFDAPGIKAIALMGSYARGEAGPFSDIDLVRFLADGTGDIPGKGSHLIDGYLVVVSDVRPVDTEAWFTRPEAAVDIIAGLRQAVPLIDQDGSLALLQERARAFIWGPEMQARADAWASGQMVGWIEEVHKGLEGLRRNDVGRLLNARYGLSWGLSRLIQVQRGILLAGDNAFFEAGEAAIGPGTEWSRLRRAAFGVEGLDGRCPTLQEQVVFGLRLYVVTAGLLAGALQPQDASLVEQTVERIKGELGTGSQ